MIRAGDKVRHYSRGYMRDPGDDWRLFGSGIGPMTVIRVSPPLPDEFWEIDGKRDTEHGPAYRQITLALPPPHHQEAHYQYITVRPTKRWWQWRARGDALDIVERAPELPADVFETLAWANPKAPSRAHFTRLPRVAIELAHGEDGRVRFGIDYWGANGGFAFAPRAKWGHDHDSRDLAVAAAAAYIREQAGASLDPRIDAWLDSITVPQLDLFGSAAHG